MQLKTEKDVAISEPKFICSFKTYWGQPGTWDSSVKKTGINLCLCGGSLVKGADEKQ